MSDPSDRESYESLLEQGLDLQRRYDAILQSRTWRLQSEIAAALDSPAALLRLPARLWRILRRPPVEPSSPSLDIPAPAEPLPAGKPLVLGLIPWLRIGGAERVVLELIHGLRDELDFALLPASAVGPGDPDLLSAARWIFPAPQGDYATRVAEIVRRNPVRCILISSCPQAYAALPCLRQASNARIVDILHNTAPEGSLATSIANDRSLDLHFAVGGHQADALRHAGIAAEKTVVAHNGVDCHGRYRPQGEPSNAAPFQVAWVGRLSEEKDPFLFLRTLALLPDAQGLLIGDGPERFHVEALIRELDLGARVRVTGFTNRVADLLARCDVLALTSRTEGSPLTVLEAMSLEKPVVAADVGGVREAVEDEVSGLLVRDRTPDVFAAALRRLAADPALRRALGVRGRQRVVERFSRDATIDSYRTALRALGILEETSAKPPSSQRV